MCCCLHLRSTCNHVSASRELQIWHVFDGYASLPKNSCFQACPIYSPVRNFTRHIFCLFVIVGLFQKSFDNTLLISLLLSHLCDWCVWLANFKIMSLIIFKDVFAKVSKWGLCPVFLTLSATNLFVGSMVWGVHVRML